MAANRDVEKEFFRLLMFCHKTVLLVIRTYFRRNVLGNPDCIGSFLELHKHELFHLVGDYKCCQCKELPSLQLRTFKFRLGNQQFKKLYDVGDPQSGHFQRGSGGRIFQKCLCCITVKNDTNVKNYDISLLITILLHCGELSDNNMKWLDTIRQCRNTLCHMTDLNDLRQSDLKKIWGKLEMTVPKLAEEVDEDFKDSIDGHIDNYKHLDYNRDTVTPIMEEMRVEINNMKGFIQNQTEEAVDHMNHLFLLSEEQRNVDKKETHNHILATNTDVITKVAEYYADGMQGLENQTRELKKQHKEICAIRKSVEEMKGFITSFRRDEVQFDIEVSADIFVTENDECHNQHTEDENNASIKDTQNCMVVFTIGTPEGIIVKKEEIMQYFKKAMDMVNIAAPFQVKFVEYGSIIIGTLLPVDIIKNAEEFRKAIRKFLDQMVTKCEIDTSIPLVVNVKITVSDFKQQESDKCFIEEANRTQFKDKAVQAVPTMVDQIVEARISEIDLYDNQGPMYFKDKSAGEIDAELSLPGKTTKITNTLSLPDLVEKSQLQRIQTLSQSIPDIDLRDESSYSIEDETTAGTEHSAVISEMDSFDISWKQTKTDTMKGRIIQSFINRGLKMSDFGNYLSEATHDDDTLVGAVYTRMPVVDDKPNFEKILKQIDLQDTDKYNTGGNQQNPSISIDNIDKCDAEN